jgi:hypothetical protein
VNELLENSRGHVTLKKVRVVHYLKHRQERNQIYAAPDGAYGSLVVELQRYRAYGAQKCWTDI